MAWSYLLTAGLLEVGWAIGLKYLEGFSRLLPSVLTVAAMVATFVFLRLARARCRRARPMWCGTVATVILGVMLFGKPVDVVPLVYILLIITGVVGLRLVAPH